MRCRRWTGVGVVLAHGHGVTRVGDRLLFHPYCG
jgi:hypothetical protein